MKSRKAVVVAWTALALGAPMLGALSVRSPAKDVVLDGIAIGQSRSLADADGNPVMANTGGEEIHIRMSLAVPRSAELMDGYEPLPSLSWIRLESKSISLKPKQETKLDGVITIPKKLGLRGGQYQAQWIGDVEGAEGGRLKFISRLLIQVADDADAAFQQQGGSDRNEMPPFSISPPDALVRDASVGKKTDIGRRDGVFLKLINPEEADDEFALRLERNDKRITAVKPGFEPAPNPHFLRIKEPLLRVSAGKIGVEDFELNIPDEARYRNKRWFFLVESKLRGYSDSGSRIWILYVTTE